MRTKMDGIKVRDWLRHFFDSEKELVVRYLHRGNPSKARDCIATDLRIIELMRAAGFPMNKSNLSYHRKDVLQVSGQPHRFIDYQIEWNKANGITAPKK